MEHPPQSLPEVLVEDGVDDRVAGRVAVEEPPRGDDHPRPDDFAVQGGVEGEDLSETI